MKAMNGSKAWRMAKVLAAGLVALWCASCETQDQYGDLYGGDEAKGYGQFRVDNGAAVAVQLWVGGELRVTAEPKQRKNTRAPDGLVEVSVRTEAGKVLWKQMADVPDNAFAQYNVQENLSVILTAGNISDPYKVGSKKQQVKLSNQAAYGVEVLIDGKVIGAVGPYLYATYNVPKEVITISFRKERGATLFSQVADVPRNGYFAYTVLPNGGVTATGGEVEPNTQRQCADYYYDCY